MVYQEAMVLPLEFEEVMSILFSFPTHGILYILCNKGCIKFDEDNNKCIFLDSAGIKNLKRRAVYHWGLLSIYTIK